MLCTVDVIILFCCVVVGRRWLNSQNSLCLFLTLLVISIPLICIWIGYLIGSAFMPPPSRFPAAGIVMDMSRLNYSWYNTHNVSINFIGGLGNQMFQYASLYGVGKANGLKPLIADGALVSKVFRSLRARRTSESSSARTAGYGQYLERKSAAFDSKTFSLNFMRNILLEGYFQSWRYFDHIRSDLRKQFAFRASTVAAGSSGTATAPRKRTPK